MREIEKIFKALSDRIRLRILNLFFYTKKLYPCEIMSILNISQTRVSRNINILLDSDFLKQKREGKYISYYLNEELDKEFKSLLIKKLINENRIREDLKQLNSFKNRKSKILCEKK